MRDQSFPQVEQAKNRRTSILSWLCRLTLALERHWQRRDLTDLTDEQLRDVGLTRRDVERECAKPFWDV
ncbi:DUF1127 domain-containing protein [Nitratireductor kimnyeongensis]|uniref:DUF1127 domain-containing protein n=1 Tax=Nitratireductor kimnyeongensis TaxID=430679 RepID=A0ABW0TDF1_9HYPH|nr:DUF1127 domain-containing protein [Nitratireductor kimnyeongensis]QZZ37178.1 DUF1127 domain-containing protein [Nitratireductor kimnyeongensis]